MRAPALVGIITALHILAITAFVLIQGCGTTRPTLHSSQSVEPPPPANMPPRAGPAPSVVTRVTPRPEPFAPAVVAPADAGSHTIAKGETLSHVAKKYGVTTRELVELNNLSNPNSLKIGQVILIPPHARAGASAPAPAPAPATSTSAAPGAVAAGGTYVVMAGDSLSKIARDHGVKVADLRGANGLTSDLILVGQKLVIPGAASAAASAAARPAPKPSVTEEVDVSTLMDDSAPVAITDIAVPASSTPTPSPAIPATSVTPQNKAIPYTVVAGDTLDEIAKLFIVSKAEIIELNNLGPADQLTPGQKILIPPSGL